MNTNKISLKKEKETLLVPLYGKAIESRKKKPVLIDEKATEILKQIEYDFPSLKIPGKTNTMMCLRAKLLDNFTGDFLNGKQNALVVHLGCGLDSRYVRIGNEQADWYDLDYPEVIDIRRKFYPESARYHLIASSVADTEWVDSLPGKPENSLVIAEGLFMYLKEDEIKALLSSLKKRLGSYTLIFDAFSKLTAKRVKNHPSIKKTGATIHWGIDDPREPEAWDPDIRFIRDILFSSNEEIDHLAFGTRLIYRIANLFPVARNAQRILIYKVQ